MKLIVVSLAASWQCPTPANTKMGKEVERVFFLHQDVNMFISVKLAINIYMSFNMRV